MFSHRFVKIVTSSLLNSKILVTSIAIGVALQISQEQIPSTVISILNEMGMVRSLKPTKRVARKCLQVEQIMSTSSNEAPQNFSIESLIIAQ